MPEAGATQPLVRAIDALQSPLGVEAMSAVVGGPGVLVVDLAMPEVPPPGDRLEAARRALAELPCPSIGVRRGSLAGGLATWARGLDAVVVDAEAGARDDEGALACTLAPVLEAARSHPHAALALVQLLRHGQGIDLHEALVAESLAYSTLQAGPEFARWLGARPAPPERVANALPPVLVERTGDVLHLALNRPEKRNAYGAAMRDALCEALALAASDPALRVTISGRGESFCSGGDLDEFGSLPDPATAHAVRSTRNAGRLLSALRDRSEVYVHGHCVGAGVELPAFAGCVVAAADTRFSLPEIRLGLVPGAGGTASLPRRIGRQHTTWLALSGVAIDAPTARAWGLVDAIDGVRDDAPETLSL